MHNNINPTNTKTPRITLYYRTLRLFIHVMSGVVIAAMALPFCTQAFKLRVIKWWCTRLLSIFNIQVVPSGHVPTAGKLYKSAMVIGNHISWTDIHALNSIVPLRFIAKSEIRHWPVFGYLAAKANVLFIDRAKRHDAGRIVKTAVQSLNAGDHICFFPEGTTTDGTHMLPFKSSLIQAAIEANAELRPVAIYYPNQDRSANIAMAYAGETSMIASMWAILCQLAPVVELHFLPPIIVTELPPLMQERRQLTQHVHQLIHAALYNRTA